eukprot:gb/GECH01012970.1/.p1 GENE.gb/GECH01012970.1/~~gb/GECH01012970.1/.p1  ORF type:complete len:390 (+),score=93.74 gb/GECH01012970.1/:1-1170(+)
MTRIARSTPIRKNLSTRGEDLSNKVTASRPSVKKHSQKVTFLKEVGLHSSQAPIIETELPGKLRKESGSSMVVTVFGCTGFVGRYLVNDLAHIGAQVVCPHRGEEYWARHLRVSGDIGQVLPTYYYTRSDDSVLEMLESSDVVVNLVGKPYDEWLRFGMREANVNMAERIARLSKQAGVKRLIHFSSMGASLDSKSTFWRQKAESEELVMQNYPRATILRPSTIVGYEDNFLNFYAKMLRTLPGIPLINNGDALVQPVYVTDVSEAVISAIYDESTEGLSYDLAGPEVMTVKDAAKDISRIIGEPYDTLNLASPIAKAIGMANEWSRTPTWTRDWVERMKYNQTKPKDTLGLEELGVRSTFMHEVKDHILMRWKSGGYFLDVNFTQSKD